jgi:hypothetical protein
MQQLIALTHLPMPVLILLGAGLVTAALWFVTEGRRSGGGSGGYAVWIVVPFILAICGAGVWLLVRTMGSNFGLLH